MKNRDLIEKKLCNSGYLPKELIPCFDANQFWIAYHQYRSENPGQTNLEPISISIPRYKKDTRRIVNIVHPSIFKATVDVIVRHWKTISQLELLSDISISKTTIPHEFYRAVPLCSVEPRDMHQKIMKSFNPTKLFCVDIKQFYSNIDFSVIYKALLDMNQDDLSGLKPKIKDCLEDLQKISKGLPIGPDTSRILSELIGCLLDIYIQKDWQKEQNNSLVFFRHVDDFYIYAKDDFDYIPLARYLSDLFARFGFFANSAKTELILLTEENSKSLFSKNRNNTVDLVVKNASAHGDWEQIRGVLLEKLMTCPIASKDVGNQLIMAYQQGYVIDMEEFTDYFDDIIEANIDHGHHYEIIWILWIGYNLKYKIPTSHTERLLKMNHPIINMLCLGIQNERADDLQWMNKKLLEHWELHKNDKINNISHLTIPTA